MKNKVIMSVLLVLSFLFVPNVVDAENIINNLHMDITLHEDGSATIIENRQMQTDEDTEIFITMDNLQNSEVSAFTVQDFTEVAEWDSDASFEEKSYKYGTVEIEDGYELIWGISEYGNPTYSVQYQLSNLVQNLNDGQALLWNFNTFSDFPTENFTLTLSAPYNLEETLLDYYGFGFEGDMNVSGNRLTWTGNDIQDSSVTLLLQFPEDTFLVPNRIDMTLVEQQEMATTDSSYNSNAPLPTWTIILLATFIGIGGISLVGAISYAIKVSRVRKANNHFTGSDYIKANKDKVRSKTPDYDGDLADLAYIITKVASSGGTFSNYFLMYLLKWTTQGQVILKVEDNDSRWGPDKDYKLCVMEEAREIASPNLTFEQAVTEFKNNNASLEMVIWLFIRDNIDPNGELKETLIENWSNEHSDALEDLITEIPKQSMVRLNEQAYLENSQTKAWGATINIERLTPKGEQLTNQIAQLNNFYQDSKDQIYDENINFETLLYWAAAFGQAENLQNNIEKYEPELWSRLSTNYPYIYGNFTGYNYWIYQSAAMSSVNSSMTSTSSVGGGAGAGGGGGGGSR